MDTASPSGPRIFLSYRRSGEDGFVGRVTDRLAGVYGDAQVFRDLTGLRVGESFEQRIGSRIDESDVVIALIGERWAGRRWLRRSRLHDADDWVRKELEHALASGKPVVPVLLGNAALPRVQDLPASMKGLLAVHTGRIRDETFAHDIQQLVAAIDALVARGPRPEGEAPFVWRLAESADAELGRRLGLGLGLAVVAALGVAGAWILAKGPGEGPAVRLDDPLTWTAPPPAAARGPVSHLALQLALLELQASTRERTGDNDGYNVAKFTQRFPAKVNLPWSSAFVGWCYLEAAKRHWNAASASLRFTDSPNTAAVADSLREQGWLVEPFDAGRARPGDIVFFMRSQRLAHLEIVYAVAEGKVCSIGGNVENKVSGRCRPIASDAVAALGALPPEAFAQGE